MKQKGFVPVFILLVIAVISVGVFYIGKNFNRLNNLESKTQPAFSNPSPVISSLSSAPDVDKWVKYKIKALNIEFKLPEDLSSTYGSLIEKEAEGTRGTELKINFSKEPNKFIIYAPSLEYTPSTYEFKKYDRGYMLITLDEFIGFKEDNGIYFGILPFNKPMEIPSDGITQYRHNGRDILKIKSLYSSMGMATRLENKENPPKTRAILTTGNEIYPALNIQAILDKNLTETVFEQILATFDNVIVPFN